MPTREPMRIGIVTSGRFHVVDLARELAKQGHLVQLYSALPPWETNKFGLERGSNAWLGPHTSAAILLARKGPKKLSSLLDGVAIELIDRTAAHQLQPCDVLIGMSGLSVAVLRRAKELGALVVLERGSQHILSQREIMEQTLRRRGSNVNPVVTNTIDRELFGYRTADVISIPSSAVEESFLRNEVDHTKLERNPYGTSLELFRAPTHRESPRRILMVGGWSVRKGCDVLFDAFLQMPSDVELWHVGATIDLPMPSHPRFRHFEPVPQRELPSFYQQCGVFALASREEGMAVVQMQALASGLSLVCTSATGGADLGPLVPGSSVFVSRVDDTDDFAKQLTRAIELQPAVSSPDLSQLSWAAYAKRYEEMLRRRLAARDHS